MRIPCWQSLVLTKVVFKLVPVNAFIYCFKSLVLTKVVFKLRLRVKLAFADRFGINKGCI